MAAEVTGFIGNEQVELNNAATESTLRALLAATAGSADKVKAAFELASKTFDPAIIESVNNSLTATSNNSRQLSNELSQTTAQSKTLRITFSALANETGKLIEGTASLSGIMGAMIPLFTGKIGLAVEALAMLAKFQENSLKSYQAITSAGANFSGSLTDMRLAAAQSYLTLDQFTNIVKNNSSTLAKMGGTVDDGVRAFASLNKSLIQSDAGRQLLALGLTTEDVSNGMLSFINATGGRSKAELANTSAITEATSNYLVELDKLTQFSGISRKEQEEQQKKAATSGAYQRALADMTEDQKARAAVGLAAAQTKGAGAVDLFMANVAGLPAAMTADGRKFQGYFNEAGQGITQMANAVRSTTGTFKDVENGFGKANEGLVNGVNAVGRAGDAMSLNGDKVMNDAQLGAIQLKKMGGDTAAGTAALMKEITENQKKQNQSQAKEVADAALALKKLGASILLLLSGPIAFMSSALKTVADRMGLVGTALLAFVIATKLAESKLKAGGTVGAAGRSLVSQFGTLGATMEKAMWVKVVPGFGGLPGRPGGSTGPIGDYSDWKKGDTASKDIAKAERASQVRGRIAGGAGIGALALGMIGTVAEEKGATGLATGLDIGSSALSGAALGAEIGLLGGPFAAISAPLGAAIGGTVGLVTGIYQNWDKLKSKDEAKKPGEMTQEDIANFVKQHAEATQRNNEILLSMHESATNYYDKDLAKPVSVRPLRHTDSSFFAGTPNPAYKLA